MNAQPDIKKLSSSWTKYDIVKLIQATIDRRLEKCIGDEEVDVPVLRNYLGVANMADPIPSYWEEIYKYPNQVGLFSLIAALFTHYENIEMFGNEFNRGNMEGVLTMVPNNKHYTNLRSALVISNASQPIFRRKSEVPYDLSILYESGEVGVLMKSLLKDRLVKVGYSENHLEDHFFDVCEELFFSRVFGLSNDQFTNWINGEAISNSLFELNKNGITYEKYGTIKALKVKQWLYNWDQIPSYGQKNRRKPDPFFYQFKMPALLLKRIYSIHSRRASVGRVEEPYSQRKHSELRSNEIREYVNRGYPWSTLSVSQRETEQYKELQMPGWLPTSIIANILSDKSERRQKKIEGDSVIKIVDIDDNFADIILPNKIWSEKWTPLVSPIEIIDGQHRIKAFDSIKELEGNYEFPLTAFNNLDFTWQAYLFYIINIKPKRINTSLAFDLMPLLRVQEWLEQDLSGPDIYRKVRAQELTELLWSCPISPWHNRINMLGDIGDNKGGPVSQNAFINSLTTSFVKKWEGKTGGLFGGEMHQGEQDVIQWDKETQCAYLILIWKAINNAINKSKSEWVTDLKVRDESVNRGELAVPFVHSLSFFTTDQGIRPVLFIYNDMSFVANDKLGLNKFFVEIDYEKYTTSDVIELIYGRFKEDEIISNFVNSIAMEIVNNFDWRTPSAFNFTNEEEDKKRQYQNQFKGSGGYREMRIQLLRILSNSQIIIRTEDATVLSVSEIAKDVQIKLGL